MKYRLFWCITVMIHLFTLTHAQTSILADTITWPASGGATLFPVEAVTTKNWNVKLKEALDWITVEKKDTTAFLVTIQPNESGVDRYASVKLFSIEKEMTIPFTQLGSRQVVNGCVFDYKEQYQWLGISSEWGNKWTATISPEANSWAYATRHGDDMIMLYLQKNPGREKRTTQFTIRDGEKELAIYRVEQQPDPLPLSDYDYNVGSNSSVITLNTEVTDSLSFEFPKWISLLSQQKTGKRIRYQLAVQANAADTARYSSIRVYLKKGTGDTRISISQYGRSTYSPIGAETLCDIPIKVTNGEASSFQPGEGIERSFDGDPTTLYHSSYNNSVSNYFPITLTYKFQKPETIDYLEYYPRMDGSSNGFFKEVDVLVQTAGQKTFRLIKNTNFEENDLIKRIDFPKTEKNITAIRLVVKSGLGFSSGFASCAEMKFYRKKNINFRYTDLFTDSTCCKLKSGLTERKINQCRQPFFRNLALQMLQGNYPEEFRVQDYKAWPFPEKQAKQNGVSPFSMLDNPTGIAAVEGEPLVVFVGGQTTEVVALMIQNLDIRSNNDGLGGLICPLHKGLNVIQPANSGLIYVLYKSDTPETTSSVRIHFATGRVNGYFDAAKHIDPNGTSRWNELLSRAGDKYFDVMSNHVHFTFRTDDFRNYVPDARKLLAVYDTLVCHEQEFEGLRKYNRWMNNRLYIHSTKREMLYASPYHIGFQEAQLKYLLCPDSLKGTYCWGPAHELGHMLQVVPTMAWTAMTEVTTNIQSMEMQRLWGNPSRMHTKPSSSCQFKDTYEQAMNAAFVEQRPFAYLPDWFDQLVPFWQLRLYIMDVCGKTDFYKDVYEASRLLNARETCLTSGQLQLEFVYNSCVAASMDLRPFFGKWGWLQPTKRLYDDYYGKDSIVVNTGDVEKLNMRIDSLHLPTPVHAAEYITDNTLDLYVNPQLFLPGTSQINTETGDVKIQDFSGTIGFEIFQNGKLIGVSYYPTFTVATLRGSKISNILVKAVSPDGKRMICKMK